MNRLMIQAALCVVLCPLLAAQQVRQETTQKTSVQVGGTVWAYPTRLDGATKPSDLDGLLINHDGTPVELTPLNQISPDSAKVGAAIQFVVAKDVVVRGSTTLRAGTRLDCTITKVRSVKLMDHDGKYKLRIKEVAVGDSAKLRLAAKPDSFARRGARRMLTSTRSAVGFVEFLPLEAQWLAVVISCRLGQDVCP
jgi:hypothetical protein